MLQLSGTGALVMRLQRAGFTNRHAIDIATPEAAPIGIAFHALDLDTGRKPIDDASAKLVVSIEVIVHVENIGTYLSEIARILSLDGFALLTTPNVQSLEARTLHLLKGRLKQFDSLSDPTHIYPVHIYPFDRLLKRHGLRIAEHWGFPTDGSSPTSIGFLQLLVRALRLLGLSADPAGDHLCLKIIRDAGVQGATSKRDMVASHHG